MGSASPQIKTLISLTYDHNLRRSDKILTQLQRQLQILSVVSDLSIFEPTCMETLEFYVCLEQILSEADSKSPLAWKVINLYSHISRSQSVKHALRDEMNLMPVITNFFLTGNLSSDKIQRTLQLLRDISYGIKLNRIEAWFLKLIPELVSYINENNELDEVKEAALFTLTNLCRGNHPAIVTLKESSERKTLMKTLIQLKNPSIRAQLVISELMIYIKLDQSKLEKDKILDLLFMVATDGFAEQDEKLIILAKDIFKEIIAKFNIQETIKTYTKFVNLSQGMLKYVTEDSDAQCVGALFELLSLVVCLEVPDVTQNLHTFFPKALPWLSNRLCGVGPMALIEALVTAADDNTLSAHIDELINAIKDCINVKEDSGPNHRESEYLILCLRLMESLIRSDASFHLKLAKTLSPPILSNLMRPFLGSKEDLIHTSMPLSLSFRTESQVSFRSLNNNSDGLSGSRKRKRTSVLDTYAEAVVRILSIVKLLNAIGPEFKVEYMEMLSQPEVMQHIVLCERSSDSTLVKRATTILSEDSVPSDNLMTLVEAHREANLSPGEANDLTPSEVVTSAPRTEGVAFSHDAGDRIEGLLSKINGTVHKTEVKDIPLTDIMELYEYKLAAMAHTEKSLQDALAASDTQNKHLQHSLLQARVESEKVRGLLRVWEDRLKNSHAQREEVESHVDEIKSSARKLRESLIKEKTQLEREVMRFKSDLNCVRQESLVKEKEAARAQKQLADANSENKALLKTIREEQEKSQKLRESLHKTEEESKKSRKEREELEKEIARLEKIQGQSKKQNSELELLIKSHEETLAEKENQIEELVKTNSSLKKIQDMIHNISSGKSKSS